MKTNLRQNTERIPPTLSYDWHRISKAATCTVRSLMKRLVRLVVWETSSLVGLASCSPLSLLLAVLRIILLASVCSNTISNLDCYCFKEHSWYYLVSFIVFLLLMKLLFYGLINSPALYFSKRNTQRSC